MTTIAFVLWMIGWPIACSFAGLCSYIISRENTERNHELASFINVVIWAVIGFTLWINR